MNSREGAHAEAEVGIGRVGRFVHSILRSFPVRQHASSYPFMGEWRPCRYIWSNIEKPIKLDFGSHHPHDAMNRRAAWTHDVARKRA